MKRDEIAALVGARFRQNRGFDQAGITVFVVEQIDAALEEAAKIADGNCLAGSAAEIRALKIGVRTRC